MASRWWDQISGSSRRPSGRALSGASCSAGALGWGRGAASAAASGFSSSLVLRLRLPRADAVLASPAPSCSGSDGRAADVGSLPCSVMRMSLVAAGAFAPTTRHPIASQPGKCTGQTWRSSGPLLMRSIPAVWEPAPCSAVMVRPAGWRSGPPPSPRASSV